jgi:hypothetical protein
VTISLETYILFVAPFIMGAGGLLIYFIAERMTPDDKPRAPVE